MSFHLFNTIRRWIISKQFKRKKPQGPRLNNDITLTDCRLVGADGTPYGIVSMAEAKAIAQEQSLDLVEASPNAKPPVVKLIDYGKFKYNQQKKANEAKKKTAISQLKEIQFRPNIEMNDLQTKLKKINQFLHQGDKVKLVMQFRGREMAYKDSGLEKFKVLISQICEIGATVESEPKFMGRRVITIVAPEKKILMKLKQQRQIQEKEAKKARQEARQQERVEVEETSQKDESSTL